MRADKVIEIVAQAAGIRPRAIVGIGRTRGVVVARQVCMWLLREVCGLTLVRTAAAVGCLDHMTVIHGCRQVAGSIREGDGDRARLVVQCIDDMLAMHAGRSIALLDRSLFEPVGVGA